MDWYQKAWHNDIAFFIRGAREGVVFAQLFRKRVMALFTECRWNRDKRNRTNLPTVTKQIDVGDSKSQMSLICRLPYLDELEGFARKGYPEESPYYRCSDFCKDAKLDSRTRNSTETHCRSHNEIQPLWMSSDSSPSDSFDTKSSIVFFHTRSH